MSDKQICCGLNKAVGIVGVLHKSMYSSSYKCTSKGSIFEDDKWWCKRHAPSKIKEREEKSWDKYVSKIYRISEINTPE